MRYAYKLLSIDLSTNDDQLVTILCEQGKQGWFYIEEWEGRLLFGREIETYKERDKKRARTAYRNGSKLWDVTKRKV
jgi:hypothetical protein